MTATGMEHNKQYTSSHYAAVQVAGQVAGHAGRVHTWGARPADCAKLRRQKGSCNACGFLYGTTKSEHQTWHISTEMQVTRDARGCGQRTQALTHLKPNSANKSS